MNYLAFLQDAIRHHYGGEARHLETVPITERFQDQTVWDGKVEVFELVSHPDAEKLFAWGFDDPEREQNLQAVIVPAKPPIITPRQAVQAYVANQYCNRKGQQ
ncbi:MAG: hypothetical protein HYR56_02580 [Acidobacteria bacterium]|nr:hypothetical protein [Acidobacteriota bacterium]